MRNFDDRIENSGATAAGRLSAAEDNVRFKELENICTTAGITLDPQAGPDTDFNMVAQAMAKYASGGIYGTCSGTANTYVVAAIGSFQPPKALFDGMQVMFDPNVVNTGTSTVNAFGLGAKTITDMAGNNLTGGELQPPCVIRYSTSAGKFLLLPWSGLQFSFSSMRGRLASAQTPTVNVYTTLLLTTSPLPAWATLASGVYTLTRNGTYDCVATLRHNHTTSTGLRIVRERSGVLEDIASATHTTGTSNNSLNCSGKLTDGLVGDKIYAQVLETTSTTSIPVSIVTSSSTGYTELTVSRIAN